LTIPTNEESRAFFRECLLQEEEMVLLKKK
jgi:hypothetical protein